MQKTYGKPIYIKELELSTLENALSVAESKGAKACFLFISENQNQSVEHIDNFLKSASIPVLGGLYPNIVVGKEVKEFGALIVPIFADVQYQLIENMNVFLSQPEPLLFELDNVESLMVLVDGLYPNIAAVITQLFQMVGHQVSVFGGGTGSLSFKQQPCVYTPQGSFQDAILLLAFDTKWEVSVAHGWEILDGPYLANEVNANVIAGLNFQPAMQVYQGVVEKCDERIFAEHEFFDIAQNYPFGIDRLDDDLLVRDPITENDGKITCVGKIPENAMVYILQGDYDNMIKATSEAVKACCGSSKASEGVLFNCISRQLFLKDKFTQELEGMAENLEDPDSLFGALVLGEIASGKLGGVNFHNKTAVMGLMTNK